MMREGTLAHHKRRHIRMGPVAFVGLLAAAAALIWLFVRPISRSDAEPAVSGATQGGVAPPTACTSARAWYVAPDGAPSAPGTIDEPFDLKTAISAKSLAKPCDTIWLRGGTYSGTFVTEISGAPDAPIVLRRHADERAVIDSASSTKPAFALNSSYVWLWGVEILNSAPGRTSAEEGGWPTDLPRGTGVVARGTGIKLINAIIHDLTRGIEVEPETSGAEFYGNLIYNNGWDGPKTSNGNGIETRNKGPRQLIIDNIIFNQYSHGILALASDTWGVDNISIEGNILFNNGLPGRSGFSRDVLIGGGKAANPIIRDNMTYGGAQMYIGYGNGCDNAVVKNNYLVGSTPLLLEKCTATVEGNTLFGMYGFGTLPQTYSSNTYHSQRPTGSVVRYRKNRYEAGRAHVAVYNWDRRSSLSIDLSNVLSPGDEFTIRDAENYNTPILQATLPAGGQVEVPVSKLKAVPPVGHGGGIAHTAPEFVVFVVEKLNRRPAAPRATN
jgi:hypothetical protein